MVLVQNLAYIRLLVATASSTFILVTCGCDMKVSSYHILTDCDGKMGTNFIMSTLEDVTRVECAMRCEEMYQCMVFFHNSRTRSCTFHSRTLTDLQMLSDANTCCFAADDIAESWIVDIISVSSSYPRYPSTQMIGPPDEQPWAQYYPHQKEFLEVRFSAEMYMEQIHIYEVIEYGELSAIKVLTPEGTWYPVWTAEELKPGGTLGTKKRILFADLTITDFKTASIHIDIQNKYNRAYHEVIDAIRVCGKGRRFSERNYVL